MENNTDISCDNNTIGHSEDCKDALIELSIFSDIVKPLALQINETLTGISEMLLSAPALINLLQASVPKEILSAVLTDGQKTKIASGVLKLMTKKDGTLLATIVNPNTGKTVSTIPLQHIKVSPEIGQAIMSYSTQLQIAQIAENIEIVQKAVEDVRYGQEFDRLATAFSCQQKFLQVKEFQNIELRQAALLRIALDAEDSRNLLMQSQNANLNFIKQQPESLWKKFIKGAAPKEISFRMNEIRNSLYTLNVVSIVEAVAYQELGEMQAAQQSLKYYGEYIQSAYLSKAGFVERLNQIGDSPTNYWTETIPEIEKKIAALPLVKIINNVGE